MGSHFANFCHCGKIYLFVHQPVRQVMVTHVINCNRTQTSSVTLLRAWSSNLITKSKDSVLKALVHLVLIFQIFDPIFLFFQNSKKVYREVENVVSIFSTVVIYQDTFQSLINNGQEVREGTSISLVLIVCQVLCMT